MEYTHEALIAAGFTRFAPDPIRGVGFVVYKRRNIEYKKPSEIVFVGNNATMEAWTEEHWKGMWPKVYAWFIDPKQRGPHHWKEAGGLFHFVFIKGEDPFIQNG